MDSVPSWYRVRLSAGTEGFVSKRWTDVVALLALPSKVQFLDVGTGDSDTIDVAEHEIVIDGGNTTGVLHDYARDHGLIDGPNRTRRPMAVRTIGEGWRGCSFRYSWNASSYH